MIWRRRRKTESGRAERDAELRSVRAQLRDAEHELETAQRRTSEIAEIYRTLRALGERNHFAPLVIEALGGKRR